MATMLNGAAVMDAALLLIGTLHTSEKIALLDYNYYILYL
jgi:translation initiation factor 2 gamma subunit (eIF-2gamma)